MCVFNLEYFQHLLNTIWEQIQQCNGLGMKTRTKLYKNGVQGKWWRYSHHWRYLLDWSSSSVVGPIAQMQLLPGLSSRLQEVVEMAKSFDWSFELCFLCYFLLSIKLQIIRFETSHVMIEVLFSSLDILKIFDLILLQLKVIFKKQKFYLILSYV